MEVLRGVQALTRQLKHPVFTIGNFDGVHLGHQRILRLAVEKARARGGECVAMTFRPHPQAVLRAKANAAATPLLTTYDEKLELLAGLGVTLVIEQPFNQTFAALSAAEFFDEVILKKVAAEAIVIGYDFGFGMNREGSIQTLNEGARAAGIEVTMVAQQQLDGEVISSSCIRAHLLKGEIERANLLLGREFSYCGVVIQGDGRGRLLGFPTANLPIDPAMGKLVPPYGVYATHAVLNGDVYFSVTHIGVRPTFEGSTQHSATVECHLLDYGKGSEFSEFYGQKLDLRFVSRLREERKFNGIPALKQQIAQDISQARQIFGDTGAA